MPNDGLMANVLRSSDLALSALRRGEKEANHRNERQMRERQMSERELSQRRLFGGLAIAHKLP